MASIFPYSLQGRPKAGAGYPFLFFLFNQFFVNFTSMNPNPTHLLPSYLIPQQRRTNLTVEAVVCHSVSTAYIHFVHTLLANVHCNESLVWYKASGFCYSVDIGTSLLWESHCCLGVTRSCSFGSVGPAPSCPPAVQRWGGCEWADSKPWIWA